MEIKPPVPIAQIAGPTDRFRCAPYKSVIFARACADRQAMSEKPRDQRSGDYTYCNGCEDGPRVRAQLGLIAPESLVHEPSQRVTLTRNGKKRGRPKKNAATPRPSEAPSKATLAAVAAQPTALPMKPPGTKAPPPAANLEPRLPASPDPEPQRRDGLEQGPPHALEEPTAPSASPKQADPIDEDSEAQAEDPLEAFVEEMHGIEKGLLGIERETRDLVKRIRALRARLERKP